MTGFGKESLSVADYQLFFEIRTLNSRSLDLGIRLPQGFKKFEPAIRKICSDGIKRGKAECQLIVQPNGSGESSLLDRTFFNRIKQELLELSPGLSDEKLAELVVQLMCMGNQEEPEVEDSLLEGVEQVAQLAVDELNRFRALEGKALESELKLRIENIESQMPLIEEFEPERLNSVKQKLHKSLQELQVATDPYRLEQELIFYAERFDITEEKVRLSQHCRHFLEVMAGHESAGKKLNFIAQEMGREINTLGSKSNHYELQKIVIHMKDELEKIKEQLLNIL